MRRVLVAAALALMLAGCTSAVVQTEGVKVDSSRVLDIKTGTTTRQEVVQMFGTPTEVTGENGEEKMVYVFKKKTVPTYFGGLVESEAQSKETSSTLDIILKDGVVQSYRFKSEEK